MHHQRPRIQAALPRPPLTLAPNATSTPGPSWPPVPSPAHLLGGLEAQPHIAVVARQFLFATLTQQHSLLILEDRRLLLVGAFRLGVGTGRGGSARGGARPWDPRQGTLSIESKPSPGPPAPRPHRIFPTKLQAPKSHKTPEHPAPSPLQPWDTRPSSINPRGTETPSQAQGTEPSAPPPQTCGAPRLRPRLCPTCPETRTLSASIATPGQ